MPAACRGRGSPGSSAARGKSTPPQLGPHLRSPVLHGRAFSCSLSGRVRSLLGSWHRGTMAFDLGWSRGPGAKSNRVIGTSACFSRESAVKLPCGHSCGLGLFSVALGVIQIITVESFRKQFCSALAPLLTSLPHSL